MDLRPNRERMCPPGARCVWCQRDLEGTVSGKLLIAGDPVFCDVLCAREMARELELLCPAT